MDLIDWPEAVHEAFCENRVLYSGHSRREMSQEEFGSISDQELYEAVGNAEVIEEYPDDKPYPSVLLLGFTQAGRALHGVFAFNRDEQQVIVVTVYQPDPDRWDDLRRRKK